ncbi:MAG: hypothetical protein AB8H79_13555 [Myxococcota bacterium]
MAHARSDTDTEDAYDAPPIFDDDDDDGTTDAEDAEEEARRRRERKARQRRRARRGQADVEIEREVTKRALIEAVSRLVVVVLYMAFTLVRERDAGVVALDPEDDGLGPEDDWAEV